MEIGKEVTKYQHSYKAERGSIVNNNSIRGKQYFYKPVRTLIILEWPGSSSDFPIRWYKNPE